MILSQELDALRFELAAFEFTSPPIIFRYLRPGSIEIFLIMPRLVRSHFTPEADHFQMSHGHMREASGDGRMNAAQGLSGGDLDLALRPGKSSLHCIASRLTEHRSIFAS